MTEHDGSDFVRHISCPACGSRDNRGVFTDGHEFCFGCHDYKAGDSQSARSAGPASRRPLDLIPCEITGLRARKITEETCQKFNYGMGDYKGKKVHVAHFYNADGQVVAQKIRDKDKKFKVLGSVDDALPFGAQCWPKMGRMITVTEGEIDALSMSQVQGNKWPVVSLINGASSVKKFFAKNLDYFRGFDSVILMFDMDEPGREAAKQAASILGSRAKIAELPLKDANEMLMAGRVDELINAMWKAVPYKPEDVVDMADLRDRVLTRPLVGLSWPFETLTKLTYGIRRGELYALGAGTGVGKTDLFTQTMEHVVRTHKEKIGVFSLEQGVQETALRLVGKFAKRPLHIPECWDEEMVKSSWDQMVTANQVFLYDSFGNNEWKTIREKIEYLYHAEGVWMFFLDHLTALAAWQDDERKALETLMSEMSQLCKKLDITIFFISHLATPEGKPHEEGGRVTIRHFKGSRAIGYWCHFMFGMERDQQAEDYRIRQTTTFRVLKDRYTGRATGETFFLGYDADTGMLSEVSKPDSAQEHGFQTEEPAGAGASDF